MFNSRGADPYVANVYVYGLGFLKLTDESTRPLSISLGFRLRVRCSMVGVVTLMP